MSCNIPRETVNISNAPFICCHYSLADALVVGKRGGQYTFMYSTHVCCASCAVYMFDAVLVRYCLVVERYRLVKG